MYEVPGTCIRLAFVPEGTSSHSDTFIQEGKSKNAHEAIIMSAKILATSAYDLINKPELAKNVKEEFLDNKSKID